VDPVPDPLLLRKSGSAGNRTRASESVAKNSDHWTTEVVTAIITAFIIIIMVLQPFVGPWLLFRIGRAPWA
jgi:hypothetical protein